MKFSILFVSRKLQKFKSPGDILTLNDQLCHKTYPDNLRSVFKGILTYHVSGPKSNRGLSWTPLDFPGLLPFFVEIMSDKVVLDHKTSYLIYFENFHSLWFFSLKANFCLKLLKTFALRFATVFELKNITEYFIKPQQNTYI